MFVVATRPGLLRFLVVVAVLVVGVVDANYHPFSSACVGSDSWAKNLNEKLVKVQDVGFTVPTLFYLSLGYKVTDSGVCVPAGRAVPVEFKATQAPLNSTGGDFRKGDQSELFKECSVNPEEGLPLLDSMNNIEVLWRWQDVDEVFELQVKTTDTDNTHKLDTFSATGRGCSSPLPLSLRNENNPNFKCAFLSLYPDTCERAMHLSPTKGRAFSLRVGRVKGEECKYPTGEGFRARFSLDVFGSDEEDRSFHVIRGTDVIADAERLIDSKDVFDLEEEAPTTLPPANWAFRTARGEFFDNGDIVYRPTDERNSNGKIEASRHILEVTADIGDPSSELYQLLSSLASNANLEQEMDLGRTISEDETTPGVIAFSLRNGPDGSKKKCGSDLGEGSWGAAPTAEGFKSEVLMSQPITIGASPTTYCLEMTPTAIEIEASPDRETPCALFKNLWANNPETSDTLFVSLGKYGATDGVCLDNDYHEQAFRLRFKQDLNGRGSRDTAWRMAEPTKGDVAPGSWSWRFVDSTFSLSFKPRMSEVVDVFSLKCGAASSWEQTVMTKVGTQQTYDCAKLTLTPDACDHAIGLGAGGSTHVSFEADLASNLHEDHSCDYVGNFQSFSFAFTGESWRGNDDWKTVVVQSPTISLPSSWRWRELPNDIISIAFEVPADVNDPTKLETIEFHGSEPCLLGTYPNTNKPWEMKSVDNDSGFVCLRLDKHSVTTSDYFKQADMFEVMVNLKSNPFAPVGEDENPTFGTFDREFKDYSQVSISQAGNKAEKKKAAEKVFVEALEKVHIPKAVIEVTGEQKDLFSSVKEGSSHCLSGPLPHGHPTIKTGKVHHVFGMHTRAVFIKNPRAKTDFTGLFSKDKVPLIVRYSPSNAHSPNYLQGWSFKFFRDQSLPTDDLVTYPSLRPVTSCSVFPKDYTSNFPAVDAAQPVSNTNLPPTLGKENGILDPLKQWLMEQYLSFWYNKDKATAEQTGDQVLVKQPHRIGISHLFLDDPDSWKARNSRNPGSKISRDILSRVKMPEQLIFVPDQETVTNSLVGITEGDELKCTENRISNMEAQLSSLPLRANLFHVHAAKSGSRFTPGPKNLLGTIIIQEEFSRSWYGDGVLHFKHEAYDSDELYWAIQSGTASTEETNGNGETPTNTERVVVPNTPGGNGQPDEGDEDDVVQENTGRLREASGDGVSRETGLNEALQPDSLEEVRVSNGFRRMTVEDTADGLLSTTRRT